ncbi:dihydrolipoamide acetyltransferase family protein [Aurantimonas marianensis]|uniref:Dihydrolipoamide acetyltransferase component of pyruvate dehydrogenase complex n=1 Tax=Aurantimonas marianensis TaxID=2920428 RepID=A0A9X2H4M8_9HYPH|nr:2-oxo acid dehydrogenase subunit E2 [Aurantimonas marianensis]
MGTYTIKLPDVGEGVAEAELVEWHVAIGDPVKEDMVLAAVMTDKATVDVPSPVDGTVKWLGGEVGDTLAVGAALVKLVVEGEGGTNEPDENPSEVAEKTGGEPQAPPKTGAPDANDGKTDANDAEGGRAQSAKADGKAAGPTTGRPAETAAAHPTARSGAAGGGLPRKPGEKPLASPAVRRRAMEAGVDLRRVAGSGPAGRISQTDLDAYLEGGGQPSTARGLVADTSVNDVRIVGLRRKIAEKMALAKSRIAHITYVEEIDVEALEELRAALNRDRREDHPKLTLLPFLMRAMVIAIRDQPALNALYDDDAGILHQHGGVHIGIAAQTDSGLVVPVVRHAEARDIWGCAAEVARLGEAAKAGSTKREELSGSTITITSLGALGGIATTPVINHPEVAIVGVNKMEVRPVWDGSRFIPRKRMNLSSSFDHRVIDGWDAARFVQRIKALLENPAMIFVEEGR